MGFFASKVKSNFILNFYYHTIKFTGPHFQFLKFLKLDLPNKQVDFNKIYIYFIANLATS